MQEALDCENSSVSSRREYPIGAHMAAAVAIDSKETGYILGVISDLRFNRTQNAHSAELAIVEYTDPQSGRIGQQQVRQGELKARAELAKMIKQLGKTQIP